MEKRRMDDFEPGPVPAPKSLDRFGFVKQEVTNPAEALLAKNKSAYESKRCVAG